MSSWVASRWRRRVSGVCRYAGWSPTALLSQPLALGADPLVPAPSALVEREDGSLVNYYTLLGVSRDATRGEIKTGAFLPAALCHTAC